MHKFKLIPLYIYNYLSIIYFLHSIRLKLNSDVHQYSTRSFKLLRLPFYNKIKSQRSFLYSAIKIWDNFSDFSHLIYVNSFKISVHSFYLDSY